MSDLRADLAYLRDVTRDDPAAKRRIGALMIAAGIVFGLLALRSWAFQRGLLPWSQPWIGLPPFDAVFLFLTAATVIRWHFREEPRTAASRALSTALNSTGVSVVVVSAALLACARATGDRQMLDAFPAILFALYGSAWWVVFSVTRERWAAVVVCAAFGCTMIAASLAGSPEKWLVLSIGLWLVVALPGWALFASARAAR